MIKEINAFSLLNGTAASENVMTVSILGDIYK